MKSIGKKLIYYKTSEYFSIVRYINFFYFYYFLIIILINIFDIKAFLFLMFFTMLYNVISFFAQKKRPFIVITDKYLLFHINFFKKKVIDWKDVRAYSIEKQNLHSYGARLKMEDIDIIKLIYYQDSSEKEIIIYYSYLKNKDDFLEIIKKRIPDISQERFEGLSPIKNKEKDIRYNDFFLKDEGLFIKSNKIPWEHIFEIELKNNLFFLKGYKDIIISYRDQFQVGGEIIVKAESSEQYRNFLIKLITHARDTKVDSKVYLLARISPKNRKKEFAIRDTTVISFLILLYLVSSFTFSNINEIVILTSVLAILLFNNLYQDFKETKRKKTADYSSINKCFIINLAINIFCVLLILLYRTFGQIR